LGLSVPSNGPKTLGGRLGDLSRTIPSSSFSQQFEADLLAFCTSFLHSFLRNNVQSMNFFQNQSETVGNYRTEKDLKVQ